MLIPRHAENKDEKRHKEWRAACVVDTGKQGDCHGLLPEPLHKGLIAADPNGSIALFP